jgi:hypothetical protein
LSVVLPPPSVFILASLSFTVALYNTSFLGNVL